MAVDASRAPARFDPGSFSSFRFLERELDASGRARLRYALDDAVEFVEEIELPVETKLADAERERLDGLLALLHWVAGVSYYKTALPARIECESGLPSPAVAALLEALYSEGLGELAFENRLTRLPRPRFPAASAPAAAAPPARLERVLVPVGGGKDSAVAIELVRRAVPATVLFSVGDAPPIARTAAAAGLPRLIAHRRLDPALTALNRAGAINGHVPVTAIVSCIALLAAALNGLDAVAMANERSASSGSVVWDGVEINHQFSKGLRAERLLRAGLQEIPGAPQLFSVVRPASELAIARAFAGMERYHGAFTSCNAVFRLDPARRAASWCGECPKCRFVFLALAPFTTPEELRAIFGRDLLDEEDQLEGFALLAASGGHKPFECVGEEHESVAAIRLLAADPHWREHRVVVRLAAELLPRLAPGVGDPDEVLALGDDHEVPAALLEHARALLGP
jgi:hypothetical protein